VKLSPIRHCPADELNFLAVLRKMISSASGSMMSSIRMRMLTASINCYGRRER
jgi:hypothetical protein